MEIVAGTELETNFDFEPLVQHRGLDGDVGKNSEANVTPLFDVSKLGILQILMFLLDLYHGATLWLVWGFIAQYFAFKSQSGLQSEILHEMVV